MLMIIQEIKKFTLLIKYLLYYKKAGIILVISNKKSWCPNKYIVTVFILLFDIFKSMFNEEIF